MNWHRIVIKLGTNVLTAPDGNIDDTIINSIVDQITRLKSDGKEVILVSSGAVGAGKSLVELPEKINKVTRRQVYSSIGQIELMTKYNKAFAEKGILCAQVLATKEDFRDRVHYINMKRCLLALLRDNVIPIINENDVISISELMFTDNDELAGWVSSLINASAMIILTNVDGVLADQGLGSVIPAIDPRDKSVYSEINAGRSSFGRGGMLTKVRICQKVAKLGINTYIANGKKPDIIHKITKGLGTYTAFKGDKEHSSIKKWMAHSEGSINGQVKINQGAELALRSNDCVASLLPIGVIEVKGDFKKGDLIQILNTANAVIGVGIA
ncbi:MAG: glutamate 5-kinase, partial [Bacteroidia bacterium]|nr:glutamate 5-kinase [Bacteroidia bacterium]